MVIGNKYLSNIECFPPFVLPAIANGRCTCCVWMRVRRQRGVRGRGGAHGRRAHGAVPGALPARCAAPRAARAARRAAAAAA